MKGLSYGSLGAQKYGFCLPLLLDVAKNNPNWIKHAHNLPLPIGTTHGCI
jgi:hypothetical protein